MILWHLFLHYIGVTNADWYNWWSGFFANLTIFVGAAMYIRHANCHSKGCWRIGKHEVDGTPFKTCAKHHPAIDHTKPITAQVIKHHHGLRG